MSDERKIIHVVSNSHWDREWGYPFEETRLLLLKFMDELLDLLDTDPEFHSFTMDSQTLCVEDYLELRPERRADIEKHVKSGRLIVGPWYSLPEEYICNGESLVRNLVVGHRSADSLGKVSKIGYTPFSYGQTSQIPQIYNGFDIDTIIFYRGINTPKCEYILEGPDGSRLFGSRFGTMSRFSYYIYVYRVLRYGSDEVFTRYDWDRGAAPFRLASDARPREHYYILDDKKKQWNDAPIREQLLKLVRDESEHFSSRHIVAMQGFDSSNPDPEETRIMKLCQELLPEHDIRFSSLEEYMNGIRAEVKDPIVLRGEFRDPGATGKWTHLFGDVISARPRLKQANHASEVNLQRRAEPWSAVASMAGGEYLKTALDRCWRFLLQNHPHDTITGGGIDQMEKDSHFRFDQINIICDGLSRRALAEVVDGAEGQDVAAARVEAAREHGPVAAGDGLRLWEVVLHVHQGVARVEVTEHLDDGLVGQLGLAHARGAGREDAAAHGHDVGREAHGVWLERGVGGEALAGLPHAPDGRLDLGRVPVRARGLVGPGVAVGLGVVERLAGRAPGPGDARDHVRHR